MCVSVPFVHRVLENGPGGKAVLDGVVDASSQMQNLREAIGSYRSRFLKEMRERQRNNIMNVALVGERLQLGARWVCPHGLTRG